MSDKYSKQLAELERLASDEAYADAKKDATELKNYLESKIGQSFRKFGGASMSGSCDWTFFTIRTVSLVQGSKKIFYVEINGDTIGLNVSPAFLYKRTLFKKRWSDPQYGKSGGTNKHESSGEYLHPSTRLHTTIKPSGRKPKSLGELPISNLTEHPYTPYGGSIKVDSINDFERNYIPITSIDMEKVIDLAEQVQNTIWEFALPHYERDYKAVWSEGEVLAITQTQKVRATKYLEMLDEALDQSGIYDRTNILKEFAEFMRNRKNKL